MPVASRASWKGMKTVGMLRKEKGTKAEFSQDSQYQKVGSDSIQPSSGCCNYCNNCYLLFTTVYWNNNKLYYYYYFSML